MVADDGYVSGQGSFVQGKSHRGHIFLDKWADHFQVPIGHTPFEGGQKKVVVNGMVGIACIFGFVAALLRGLDLSAEFFESLDRGGENR